MSTVHLGISGMIQECKEIAAITIIHFPVFLQRIYSNQALILMENRIILPNDPII